MFKCTTVIGEEKRREEKRREEKRREEKRREEKRREEKRREDIDVIWCCTFANRCTRKNGQAKAR
jgi:hypothetical protein